MDIAKIRDYLEENGIKQVWLADKLNISRSYLSLILSGDRVTPEWFIDKVRLIINGEPK
tara:strand:- start:1025 stop:1201 length:177 start_codon:yes stop_codon:yes gene_type:complete